MSPGHAVPLCRRLPDFVVSTDATTRCGRERTLTAMESAIRARFVRDSFHSLITGLPRACSALIRQCAVVDLARFARSELLRSTLAGCQLPNDRIAAISIRRRTLASALHAHAGLGYPAARRAAHAACGGSLLIGIACNGNAIGGTFHQRPRSTARRWPARTAFAGHGGSSYPARSRCARLQALLCTDRKS
jgi:hypothetical protein